MPPSGSSFTRDTVPTPDTRRDRCGSSFRASASASACPAPSCRRLPSSSCPGSATPVSTTSRHSARTSRSGSRRRWSGVGLIRWRSCLSTGRTGCGSRAASWTPTSGQERARPTAGRSAGTSSAPVCDPGPDPTDHSPGPSSSHDPSPDPSPETSPDLDPDPNPNPDPDSRRRRRARAAARPLRGRLAGACRARGRHARELPRALERRRGHLWTGHAGLAALAAARRSATPR
eukprot:scaffold93191_cov72-Phaeocystis_antarctica.AAC.2